MLKVYDLKALPPGTRVIRRGNRGKDVSYVQEKLQHYGYPVKVDGFYGFLSEDAVREFQEDYGLKGDGVVGPRTWAYLENPLKKGGRFIYKAEKGENLSFIAEKYRVDPENLASINGIRQRKALAPGTKIILPVRRVYLWQDKGGKYRPAAESRVNGLIAPAIELSDAQGQPVWRVENPDYAAGAGKLLPLCTVTMEGLSVARDNPGRVAREILNALKELKSDVIIVRFPADKANLAGRRLRWAERFLSALRKAGQRVWLWWPAVSSGGETGLFLLAALAEEVIVDFTEAQPRAQGPAPFAPFPFMEAYLRWLLSQFPAEKIILRLHPGGVEWREEGEGWEIAERTWEDCRYLFAGFRRNAAFYPEVQMERVIRYKKGRKTETWCENGETLARKLALIVKYNLSGVALNASGMGKRSAKRMLSAFALAEDDSP
ncbi:MAG: peptidoglycan-binding protein [Bacillota bacterium]